MGYRIIYSRKKFRLTKRSKTMIISLVICAMLLGLGYLYRPEIPESALENMAQSVRSGESIKDAVTAFCREIIENGKTVS